MPATSPKLLGITSERATEKEASWSSDELLSHCLRDTVAVEWSVGSTVDEVTTIMS